jgi:peptidoglycan hydrolase CwlO-like protein
MKTLLVRTVINMNDYIYQIIGAIATTIIGYVAGFRKSKNEIEGGRLENMEKSLKVYQLIIDDLSKKVEELTNHIVRLEATIESLKQENKQLKKHNGL